jgi:hypothetical protein
MKSYCSALLACAALAVGTEPAMAGDFRECGANPRNGKTSCSTSGMDVPADRDLNVTLFVGGSVPGINGEGRVQVKRSADDYIVFERTRSVGSYSFVIDRQGAPSRKLYVTGKRISAEEVYVRISYR